MKRYAQTILIVGLICLAALAIVGHVRSLRAPVAEIRLPTGSLNSQAETDPESSLIGNLERIPVAVTTETVQAVIGTLVRPQSYERQVQVETLWPGGQSTATASVWVDQGYTMTILSPEQGAAVYSICYGEQLSQWLEGDTIWHVGKADDKSADLAQRIPSYEDILAAETGNITQADYVDWNGLSCVFAEVRYEELDYLERYWVSVPTGLLVRAETLKGDSVVYRMTSGSINQPVSDGVVFALPDGAVLHRTG